MPTLKSSNWDVRFIYLWWDINTHTDLISLSFEKFERLRDLLDDWPASREVAPAKEVLSLSAKLWNVTFVLRAGSISCGSS